MRIVVNHLTRMTGSRICVAGIDTETYRHVRPVTSPGELLTRVLLRENGGPLGAGALVDVGSVTACPCAPEMEDHAFDMKRAKRVSDVDEAAYLELLSALRAADLDNAFGPELERVGRTYAVDPGNGDSSLAVLRAESRPVLEINVNGYGLRLWYNDAEPPAYLSVKDARLFEDDNETIKTSAVEDVNRRLRRGVDAFLMLGLTRPWLKPGEAYKRHWLQLNGLCLADRAVGDLP
ncbi:MAG: hypothetical protein WB709_05450 [Solirubrobacteraceae bacterium]